MKFLLSAASLIFITIGITFGQVAQGPAPGLVPSGAVVNTDNFEPNAPFPGPQVEHRHPLVTLQPPPANMPPPTGPEGSNYFEDPSVHGMFPPPPPPVTIASFQGNNQTGGFPPDPDLAVGPNHIIQVVNSSFRISDKNGNTIKTIGANSWYQSVLPNSGAFDPRVFYDFHANRWFMVWDNVNDQNLTAYFLVSVSDDDNPIGVWFNWALPANVYGSTPSGTWQDHETAGFDRYAYYITGRHFGFVSGYFGNAVRILPKQQFLGSSPDTIRWNDFWALRDNNGIDVDQVRPAFVYSDPGVYYLAGPPGLTSGSYFAVFRIMNPLGVPSISCTHVSVTSWSNAPNAGQLGGGVSIETGGSRLRHPPIYRDSSLWMAHSVNNAGYSSVRYLRINTVTNTAIEDAALGAIGFWHFYPALTVDKDNNISITYSRSGDTEYIGAYFTWRLNSDPPGLRPSETIRPGAGNYVVVGGGRNRWGDYMGAALDPADKNNMWFLTEYAAGTNQFAVWAHGIRLVPYPGRRVSLSRTSMDFGRREALVTSDTTPVTITNIGSAPLTITSITNSTTPFILLGVPSLPATISTFDSIPLRVVFHPSTHGTINDSITIVSNDSLNPTAKVYLTGKGVVIGRAQVGTMYGVSSVVAGGQFGNLYRINTTSGQATLIGSTGITETHGLAVRPSNKELYGTFTSTANTNIYRISSDYGDALTTRTIPLGNLRAITFSAGDTLYGATTTGRLYRINLATGDTMFIGASGKTFSGLSFNPTTGRLWASVRPPIVGRDSIYTLNTQTGAATPVGRTGLNVITPYIAFDSAGTLYALIGLGAQTNTLYTLDTTNANATLVGSTDVTGLQAIAMRTDSLVVGVEESGVQLPTVFRLEQNYPNPFNPTTRIQYALPVQSKVRLTIFNILGQEIVRLVDGDRWAGYHTVEWEGRDSRGVSVPSGLYLNKIEAWGTDGRAFQSVKKMLLVK
jgi:hypothetical protein